MAMAALVMRRATFGSFWIGRLTTRLTQQTPMQRVGSIMTGESGGICSGVATPARFVTEGGLPLPSSPSSSTLVNQTAEVVQIGLGQLLQLGLWLIKRTFQPSLIRRKRKHGFLARASTKDGIHVLNRRRNKGRRKLCA